MKRVWAVLFVIMLAAMLIGISASAETSGTCGDNLT